MAPFIRSSDSLRASLIISLPLPAQNGDGFQPMDLVPKGGLPKRGAPTRGASPYRILAPAAGRKRGGKPTTPVRSRGRRTIDDPSREPGAGGRQTFRTSLAPCA